MKYRRFNDEVFYSQDAIPVLDKEDLEFLKQEALKNPRKRARLCAHQGVNDNVHEMFIVHAQNAYVRAHKHLNKMESFFVIEGEADVVFFDEDGRVGKRVRVGPFASGKTFYYRINSPVFHTLIIRSELLCFKEVTKGPFCKDDTIFAPWAPEETDICGAGKFLERLKNEIS